MDDGWMMDGWMKDGWMKEKGLKNTQMDVHWVGFYLLRKSCFAVVVHIHQDDVVQNRSGLLYIHILLWSVRLHFLTLEPDRKVPVSSITWKETAIIP